MNLVNVTRNEHYSDLTRDSSQEFPRRMLEHLPWTGLSPDYRLRLARRTRSPKSSPRNRSASDSIFYNIRLSDVYERRRALPLALLEHSFQEWDRVCR
jgi:hypothetical protein